MVNKKCPHCGSSLRYKRPKQGLYKLLFFAKMYKCAYCYAHYGYITFLEKVFLIDKGVSNIKKS